MSIECPLCLQSVDKLKSNSHIIPRWMFLQIKEVGRFVLVKNKGVKLREQSEPKADIVCDRCEDLFRDDDTWSVDFFRDKKYFKDKEAISENGESIELLPYDSSAEESLVRFLISIILRTHLYKKNNNNGNLLGPYFRDTAQAYVDKTIDLEKFPFSIHFYKKLDSALTMPVKTKFYNRNAIEFTIFGFRTWVYFCNRKPDDIFCYARLNNNRVIAILPDAKNAYVQGIARLSHKNVKRKK